MNNLLLISIIIILFFLVGFGIYFVLSSRQVDLEKQQKKIIEQLGEDSEE